MYIRKAFIFVYMMLKALNIYSIFKFPSCFFLKFKLYDPSQLTIQKSIAKKLENDFVSALQKPLRVQNLVARFINIPLMFFSTSWPLLTK